MTKPKYPKTQSPSTCVHIHRTDRVNWSRCMKLIEQCLGKGNPIATTIRSWAVSPIQIIIPLESVDANATPNQKSR